MTNHTMYSPGFATYADMDIPVSEWEFDCEITAAACRGKHSEFPTMGWDGGYRAERMAWYALLVWTYGDEAFNDIIGPLSSAGEMELAECIADIEFIHSDEFLNNVAQNCPCITCESDR